MDKQKYGVFRSTNRTTTRSWRWTRRTPTDFTLDCGSFTMSLAAAHRPSIRRQLRSTSTARTPTTTPSRSARQAISPGRRPGRTSETTAALSRQPHRAHSQARNGNSSIRASRRPCSNASTSGAEARTPIATPGAACRITASRQGSLALPARNGNFSAAATPASSRSTRKIRKMSSAAKLWKESGQVLQQLRLPRALRPPPINAFQQHR